jgi:glycoprotein endo-alpha-1,2-mannosidase
MSRTSPPRPSSTSRRAFLAGAVAVDDRAVPGDATPTLERANGTTDDEERAYALASGNGDAPPDRVGITSFNEWHEGTMIEPATAAAPATRARRR